MAREFKVVKDIDGKEVKALDINDVMFEDIEVGDEITLRNKDYTFWASVEFKGKKRNVFTFESVSYGWQFKVDYNTNTVTCNA